MKQKHLWLAGAMMLAMCAGLASCGGDDNDEAVLNPSMDPEIGINNMTDVAVTGSALDISTRYADLRGYVNLNLITISYSKVEIGVEFSPNSDFNESTKTFSGELQGRAFMVRINGLYPVSTYFYRTFVHVQDIYFYGETYSFSTKEESVALDNNYVDLGLPSGTLWSTFNVGAEKYNEYGGKYKNKQTEVDFFASQWNSNWQLPTRDQFDELLNKCSWKWKQINETEGYEVTGPNGQTIFLPATGCLDEKGQSYGIAQGTAGYYWTRSIGAGFRKKYYLFLHKNGERKTESSFDGMYYAIRPVRITVE